MSRRLVTILTLVASAAHADPLVDAIKHSASGLGVKRGKLDGAGAQILRTAIRDARFVMLGEDHGIAQIPVFGGALCGELGAHHLALEVGPSIGAALEGIVRAPDPIAAAAAFNRDYPESVAFYNWQEELGFLQACAKASGAAPLTIWGVDQELMGATSFVLPKILATNPGPKSKAAIESLVREAAADRTTAAKSGDYAALWMLAASPKAIADAQAALAKDGSPEAQRLFGTLVESRAIYLGQASPTPYLSNRRRARLMKETFTADLDAATSADHAIPKVLLKLGGWHMYRAQNPLHSSELGALVAETAEGHGLGAVNLLAVGVKGEQLRPAGVAHPDRAAALDLAKDPDFAFLAPFIAAQVAGSWTLFDLRALRPSFKKLGTHDPELERLIFGYDFLVLISDPKAEHPLP